MTEWPWRLIDNAPRDGTEILLLVEHKTGSRRKIRTVAHWLPNRDGGAWYFWNNGMYDPILPDVKIEHWVPLPKAPK